MDGLPVSPAGAERALACDAFEPGPGLPAGLTPPLIAEMAVLPFPGGDPPGPKKGPRGEPAVPTAESVFARVTRSLRSKAPSAACRRKRAEA